MSLSGCKAQNHPQQAAMTKTIQSENEKKEPPPWWPVFAAIERERFSQLNTWGRQQLPDGTGHEFFQGMATEYKAQNDARQAAGKRGVWSKVLLEEVFEALSETDEISLEDELIQVAAVAVSWVEDLRMRRDAKA